MKTDGQRIFNIQASVFYDDIQLNDVNKRDVRIEK